MGMFDYVKSLHPLVEDLDYQTKDFDCGLDTYYITAGGRFVLKIDENWPDVGVEPIVYKEIRLDGAYEFYTGSRTLKTTWRKGQLREWSVVPIVQT